MINLALAGLLALPAFSRDTVNNPDTFTYDTIADCDSLDPAWAYDSASNMVLENVYETLFFFAPGSARKLVPVLAEKVPSRANGLISADGRTYTIPIRKGVRFQDGALMTPEDVRYSILRFLLQDRDAGPSPLLLQPLVGYPSTRDDKGRLNPNAYRDAARAVRVEGDNLVLQLPKPFAPLPTILASWAQVVSKKWAIANGDWDGAEKTWAKFNNPEKQTSPFFEHANGTGPFKLARWDRKTMEIVLDRNERYWRKPARLAHVVIRAINEFGTQKLMLEAGDADSVYASEQNYNQVKDIPGVALIDNLPILELNPAVFFTFQINPVANPNIRSGKLDGRGIPPDFFSDKDVRKGFAYAFDYAGFIRDIRRGKGGQATGCVPVGLLGHNPDQKVYTYDLKKAEEHFRKAWGGQAWEKGFELTMAYNSGNVERETVAQILKRQVESLNPKFRIDVRPIEWPEFLDDYIASKLPVFIVAWQADYPDPHNFAFPMMHSQGAYPQPQHYSNPEADRLIERAVAQTDPARRKRLYYKLQEIEYDDVPHIVIDNSVRFHTQRDWVRGWAFYPVFPDMPYSAYFYPIYKAAPTAVWR